MYKTSLYHYDLPQDLIAQKPVEPRDSSRLLLVDRQSGKISHHVFRDLPKLLKEGDLLVANRSRVFRARLLGHRLLEKGERGGKIEFFLLHKNDDGTWEGLFKASAHSRKGLKFEIPSRLGESALKGEIIQGGTGGGRGEDSPTGTVIARLSDDPLKPGYGEIPLPPYIERSGPQADDEAHYQTIYASRDAAETGSSAAPTAGLHFTRNLLNELAENKIEWQEILLHVGLGTFRPVKAEDLREHAMHEEDYAISEEAASHINHAKSQGRRVIAVGTTSVRALESSVENRKVIPGGRFTQLFLYPGGPKNFQVVDGLITNFHLPCSTLLMLVCAFGGTDLMLEAYRTAVKEKYRFFSYGDAMLIV